MKRPIMFAMALCICIGLTGCGNEESATSVVENVATEVNPEQASPTETENLETSTATVFLKKKNPIV